MSLLWFFDLGEKWQEVRRVFPHSATVAADNSRAGWQTRGHTLSCFSWLIFRLVDGGEEGKKRRAQQTLPGESGEGRGFNLLLGFLASAGPNGPAVVSRDEIRVWICLVFFFLSLLLLCAGGLV